MLTPRQLSRLRVTPAHPNRVKAAMQIAGVTQLDVAAGTGITQSQISKIASRTGRVTLATALRLAAYFGCQASDLFPREAAPVEAA